MDATRRGHLGTLSLAPHSVGENRNKIRRQFTHVTLVIDPATLALKSKLNPHTSILSHLAPAHSPRDETARVYVTGHKTAL